MMNNSYNLYQNATLCTLLQTTESRNVLKDHLTVFNPFTSISDQGRISPYNINTISSIEVMRIK